MLTIRWNPARAFCAAQRGPAPSARCSLGRPMEGPTMSDPKMTSVTHLSQPDAGPCTHVVVMEHGAPVWWAEVCRTAKLMGRRDSTASRGPR